MLCDTQPTAARGLTLMAASLRNLQHAVNQRQDAIFTCDPAGVIERVNPAFEKITGSSLETIGKDLSWIAAEGRRSDSYRRIWEQVFQERTYRGSLQVCWKQGALRSLAGRIREVLEHPAIARAASAGAV